MGPLVVFRCLNVPEISGKIFTSITKGSKLSAEPTMSRLTKIALR